MLKHKTTPLQPIEHPLFNEHKIRVLVKREELNHELIQGNKLYKLELNLKHFRNSDKKFLLTFGGAYSNHIAATAAAAHQFQIPAIGVIRGDELAANPAKWSHTLVEAQRNGMHLVFIRRPDYRLKTRDDFLSLLQQNYAEQLADFVDPQFDPQNAYILPEGGSNQLAVQGFQSLAEELDQQCPQWTNLYCAVGTGATLAGLSAYSQYDIRRILNGVATINDSDYLMPQIAQWITTVQPQQSNRWQLRQNCHAGGYAKTDPELEQFIQEIWPQFRIPIEPVYTAKAFHCFWKDLINHEISKDSVVVLLHTGGLQGVG
ncbi:1-aminocyclopropane-1-carboxylate deaminase/D-cysteine desulfhydrase [Thiomicrorhabdus xiamenensis]|uniref:Pyridoxal-phosphate dependent enzyme n=1 Tax=Thiomicrorhabdus xiamenensis TaxID=2739063 RepID=A0A7D4SIR1_9GAMM|nr:pyridoxal-phosphate dependent enzyme [Thiomicrorhabdus xiamenensis]QKI89019.1 pyridoxal-phosphate dependent enzyme [Thiomicrorhabdus xiamenensis]